VSRCLPFEYKMAAMPNRHFHGRAPPNRQCVDPAVCCAQIPAVRRRRGEQVRSTSSGSSRFSILAICTHSTFGRRVFTIGETGSAACRLPGSTLRLNLTPGAGAAYFELQSQKRPKKDIKILLVYGRVYLPGIALVSCASKLDDRKARALSTSR
jgi:hypothetical protein